MTDNKLFYPQPIIPPVTSPKIQTPGSQPKKSGFGFEQKLQEALRHQEGVKFSKHALQRMEMRKITLSPQKMAKLEEAIDKAAAKGAKDSLIFMKDLAFVVSIKNRTVITAVDGENLKENVFTNIDSAVITE